MRKWDKYERVPENYEVCSGSAPFTKWVKADKSKANIRKNKRPYVARVRVLHKVCFSNFFLGFLGLSVLPLEVVLRIIEVAQYQKPYSHSIVPVGLGVRS